MKLEELESLLGGKKLVLDEEAKRVVNESHNFLVEFSKDKVIYGINTGLGPMAQYKIEKDKQIELQYNLIRSHSSGAGQKLSDVYVKAGMICRAVGLPPTTVQIACK